MRIKESDEYPHFELHFENDDEYRTLQLLDHARVEVIIPAKPGCTCYLKVTPINIAVFTEAILEPTEAK